MVSTISKSFKTEAPHTSKGWHQFNKDVSLSMAKLFVILSVVFFSANAFSAKLPDDVRKAVLKKHLPHALKYERCIAETVKQTNLPEMLLLSVLLQEGGRTGQYSVNRDRTRDYGLGQINDVRKSEIAQIGLTINDVLNDGCKNIVAVAYLLTNEFKKAKGDLWTAVGNYHYSKYGKFPRHHYNYIKNIHSKWSLLFETVKSASQSS